MPKISVIIPTYNRSSFLGEAIESVLNQSYRDIDLLIIDDGSTDGTRDTVAPYVRSGAVRYFWQRNEGVSAARNKGIVESTGELIAFLDSDDLWLPDHLTRLNQALAEFREADFAFSGFRFIGEEADARRHNDAFKRSVEMFLKIGFAERGSQVWLSNDNLLVALFKVGFPFRIQGSMTRREFVLSHGLRFEQGISFTEEAQFVTEAAAHGRFIFVDEVGLSVRRHSENVGDHCYHGKIAASYEERIRRMKACFGGKLMGDERRAFEDALWQMREQILIERGKSGYVRDRIRQSVRFLIEEPKYRSMKSVIKMLLGK